MPQGLATWAGESLSGLGRYWAPGRMAPANELDNWT